MYLPLLALWSITSFASAVTISELQNANKLNKKQKY